MNTTAYGWGDHSVAEICNAVIARSFQDSRPVTEPGLHRLLCFLSAEYIKETRRVLADEPFAVAASGPWLSVVNSQFGSWESRPIRRFAKVALGKSYSPSEDACPAFADCLDRVWRAARGIDSERLAQVSRSGGSAWASARAAKLPYVSEEDMLLDDSYRAVLWPHRAWRL